MISKTSIWPKCQSYPNKQYKISWLSRDMLELFGAKNVNSWILGAPEKNDSYES